MAEDKNKDLVEIHVTRAAGDSCWEIVRPSNGTRTASPNKRFIAEEALREVQRAGGRAVVTYDDQNKLSDRIERRQTQSEVVNSLFAGHLTGTVVQMGDHHGDLNI